MSDPSKRCVYASWSSDQIDKRASANLWSTSMSNVAGGRLDAAIVVGVNAGEPARAIFGWRADGLLDKAGFAGLSTIGSGTLASAAAAVVAEVATGGGGVAGAAAAEIGGGVTALGGILRPKGAGLNEMTQNPRMKSPANITAPSNDALRMCSRQCAG